MKVDAKRLEEIEARAEGATDGPWTVRAGGDIDFSFDLGARYPDDPTSDPADMVIGEFKRHEDALLACYARQDIPDLVAALREARALLAISERDSQRRLELAISFHQKWRKQLEATEQGSAYEVRVRMGASAVTTRGGLSA